MKEASKASDSEAGTADEELHRERQRIKKPNESYPKLMEDWTHKIKESSSQSRHRVVLIIEDRTSRD